MTKSQLIRVLSARANVPNAVASRVVNLVFQQMTEALSQQRRVEIRGLGTLQARQYEGYQGRNPRTRAPIRVVSKILPIFRAGKEIRRRLNTGGD